jgi:hypothetical protein
MTATTENHGQPTGDDHHAALSLLFGLLTFYRAGPTRAMGMAGDIAAQFIKNTQEGYLLGRHDCEATPADLLRLLNDLSTACAGLQLTLGQLAGVLIARDRPSLLGGRCAEIQAQYDALPESLRQFLAAHDGFSGNMDIVCVDARTPSGIADLITRIFKK